MHRRDGNGKDVIVMTSAAPAMKIRGSVWNDNNEARGELPLILVSSRGTLSPDVVRRQAPR